MERFYTPREMSRLYHRVKSEAEIRAMAKRAERPLPCVMSGSKRPVIKIQPSVFALYLQYEQGLIAYDEVVEGARRSLARVC